MARKVCNTVAREAFGRSFRVGISTWVTCLKYDSSRQVRAGGPGVHKKDDVLRYKHLFS